MSEQPASQNHRISGPIVLSVGISIGVFAATVGGSGFWTPAGFRLIPSTAVGGIVAVALCIVGTILCKLRGQKVALHPLGFLAGVCLVFASEALLRSFNLLQGPAIRGEIILFSLLGLILLKKHSVRTLSMLCYATPFLLAYCFLLTANGRLLFTDDHATFFYRLALLKENFPFIPFYSPHWNGGFDARDFFATGALNFFFLSSPALYLFSLESIYNFLVIFIIFVILPGCCYAAARIERLPAPAPAIAVALSVSTSLAWYRWALHYGTMGFVTSACLMPLNLALTARVLSKEGELSKSLALLFFASITLMLFWSPSGIAFVPAIMLGLLFLRRCCKKKYVKPLLLGLVLLNIPWIMIFWSASKVSSYLGSGTAARVAVSAELSAASSKEPPVSEHGHRDERSLSERVDLQKSLRALRELANSSQPLLFYLVLPGVLVLCAGSRFVYLITFAWMFFLGTFCVPLIPKLDLDRMLVFFTLCSCVPTAAILSHLFRQGRSLNRLSQLSIALAFGFLFAGILSSGAIIRNRSVVRYWFAGDAFYQMRDAIKQHSRGGRILYAGFVLHELNNAHLAPLAHLTNTPLIASSYVHRYWKYTEVLPHEFLKRSSTGGVEEYLNLYNVSAIFTHEGKWRKYFENRPNLYQKVAQTGRFTLYERLNFTSDYFLDGQGQVLEQTSNSIRVKVDSANATLKFSYFPFVTSSSCQIQSETVSELVHFIRLINCKPGEVVEIRSKGPFSRIS